MDRTNEGKGLDYTKFSVSLLHIIYWRGVDWLGMACHGPWFCKKTGCDRIAAVGKVNGSLGQRVLHTGF